ncbi:MAG: riboflavin biosynthesis protein RibF, partial [Planctomycetota bacterium]|nr:riboflavin biosynthesis protein RibF [Planctomycetota bacterium]
MLRLDGFEALKDFNSRNGCVATIGVFDGVHLGHQAVFQKVFERAAAQGQTPAVVTFSGHPKSLLRGVAPATITSLEHRLRLFERLGFEVCLVLEFTDALRDLSAEHFLREHLIPELGLKELILGFDSKFGKGRGGTFEMLEPLSKELGIGIAEVKPMRLDGRAVSSTAIR